MESEPETVMDILKIVFAVTVLLIKILNVFW